MYTNETLLLSSYTSVPLRFFGTRPDCRGTELKEADAEADEEDDEEDDEVDAEIPAKAASSESSSDESSLSAT